MLQFQAHGMASKIPKMLERADTKRNNQAYIESYLIYAHSYFTEFKWAYYSSCIRIEAVVWLFWEYISCPALTAIRPRMMLETNDTSLYEKYFTSYAGR